MHKILASHVTTVSDLKKSPKVAIQAVAKHPVAILSHNHPAAYLLSPEMFEAFLKLKETAMLASRMEKAENGQVHEVNLDNFLDLEAGDEKKNSI